MGADRARVAHSLDRVHRLVHLERLGQSNSSLGTDVIGTQTGGIQRQVVVHAERGRGKRYTMSTHQHSARCTGRWEQTEPRVAHSLDRVHRLVHLERLGQSNSSLVPDVVVIQPEGNRRSSKWWRMQERGRGKRHRVSTPTLRTLHRAMGAHGARVAHSLDRVHRLVHLERLGQSNSSLVPDLIA
jgi:hypothetical protein